MDDKDYNGQEDPIVYTDNDDGTQYVINAGGYKVYLDE